MERGEEREEDAEERRKFNRRRAAFKNSRVERARKEKCPDPRD